MYNAYSEYTIVGIMCVYALETGLQANGVRRPPPRCRRRCRARWT